MTGAEDYQVGYGNPPLANRFVKGRSGNPTGRPKGARGITAVIRAALSERVTVNVDGMQRSMTKWEAACTQMANKAAAGDRHSARQMFTLLNQSEARDEVRAMNAPVNPEERRASDAAVMEAIRAVALGVVQEANNEAAA